MKAKITEVFQSFQGEGPYTGARQVFVRFANCNRNCVWCDTPASQKEQNIPVAEYTLPELLAEVDKRFVDCHSVSLTGGEPLLQNDFLVALCKALKQEGKKIYLETNGTLDEALGQVIDDVDIIAMDIKLPSSTRDHPCWESHERFLKKAISKNVFVKIVVADTTTIEDADRAARLISGVNPAIPLVLQPSVSGLDQHALKRCVEVRQFFEEHLSDVHIMVQMHKLMGVK